MTKKKKQLCFKTKDGRKICIPENPLEKLFDEFLLHRATKGRA